MSAAMGKKLAVSTHSRLKAAGIFIFQKFSTPFCFNTQPPKGGWFQTFIAFVSLPTFQHTAA